MTTLLPETKQQKTSMETINRDEKDALKIVKYWVESELKSNEEFRESLFKVLDNHLFCWKEDSSDGVIMGYSYGPHYIDVMDNIKKLWDQHFVYEVQMKQLRYFDGFPQDSVSKASGQVDIDTDHMFKDEMTHELKHILAVLYDLCPEQHGASNEYDDVKANTWNLFFETQIDITSEYKRLETPQIIFNDFNVRNGQDKLRFPLTVATITNEESPKYLLLIDHLVDPDDNLHQKYFEVSNLEFLMFPRDEQMTGLCAKRLCLGEAVSKGIIKNQSLAYFIGRVYLYLTSLGIDEKRMRFRQNLPNVMDHYAEDCWMAEIKSSFGWIECVLIADRSVFDLDKIGVSLEAREKLAQPKEVEKVVIKPDKKELRPAFRKDYIKVVEALKRMNENRAMDMKAALESKGEAEFEVCTLEKTVSIKRNMVSISKETKKVHHRTFKAAVIECSFVMQRIIYCLFEHSFYTRPSDDGKQEICVFRFSPLVAPKQCYVFFDQQSKKVAQHISGSLDAVGISHEHCTWANTYARADECGMPYSITVVSTSSVTIRKRDTQDQIFVSVKEVAAVLKELCEGRSTWADVLKNYPAAGSIQLPKMTENGLLISEKSEQKC